MDREHPAGASGFVFVMKSHLFRTRLIDLAVVLLGVSIVTFLMIRLVPGDAVSIMLGANAEVTSASMAELRHRLGLDQPIPVQYIHWLGSVLRGDLGRSVWTGRPVVEEIAAHAWPTIELTVLALMIGAGLAIPAGVLMARLRGRIWDTALQIGSIVGLTVPSFWLGVMMILMLAAVAPGLQLLGYVSLSENPL